jgi:hypothetical protein
MYEDNGLVCMKRSIVAAAFLISIRIQSSFHIGFSYLQPSEKKVSDDKVWSKNIRPYG